MRAGDDTLLLARPVAFGGLEGALVIVDPIAYHPKAMRAVVDAGVDCLTAINASQPGAFAEIKRFFDEPRSPPPDRCQAADTGYGAWRGAVSPSQPTSIGGLESDCVPDSWHPHR